MKGFKLSLVLASALMTIGGGSSLLADEPTKQELQTAYGNAVDAVNKANKYRTDLKTDIDAFKKSAETLKNLATQFDKLAKDLTSTNTAGSGSPDNSTITIKENAEKGELIKDSGITIKDVEIGQNKKVNAQAAAKDAATKIANDIKAYFSEIAKGNNVTDNATRIYATLNTELDNVTLLSQADGPKVTVENLIDAVYKDATGKNDDATKNIAELKDLKGKIRDALDEFVAKADKLNQTLKDAKTAGFGGDKFITGQGHDNLKANKDLQAQATAATKALKKLGGDNGANLNKVTGNKLDGAKGTDIDSSNLENKKNTGVSITTDEYGAKKLQSLLDKTFTEDEKKAYAELLAALTSLKEQLNKMTITSSLPDVAKNSNSDLVKSLNEAGLKDFVANNLNLVTTNKTGQVDDTTIAQDIAEQIEKPINEAGKSLSNALGGSNNAPTTALSMANQTNTMTRFAKLSSPYSKDLALASAIKNMDGLELASGDNSALSSIIKEYTKRFDYDNSLWANVIGAKGSTDNGDPKLYGFSVGYDRSFDNFLVGSYFTYANSKLDTSYLDSEADNFELGIYSRAYLGDSELDTTLSFGIGKNDINNYKLASEYLNGDYDSKFINVAATYGYVVRAQNNFFIKPFIGLNYAYNKNDSFSLKNAADKIAQEFNSVDGSTLSANLGVELRQYLSDGSFMFVAPSVEQELSVNRDDLVSKFRGASTSFTTKADESKDTYAKVIAGGEYAVTRDFSATISAGFKTNGDDKYVNGSLGVKYKF